MFLHHDDNHGVNFSVATKLVSLKSIMLIAHCRADLSLCISPAVSLVIQETAQPG